MANALFSKAKEAFGSALINWPSDTIKAVLIDTNAYTPNLSTHEFLSDIPLAARVAISPALSGKSITNGVADANDITFSSVTGPQSEAVALFKDTGVPETSRLIIYMDAAGGLPITPGGSDISVVWNNGAEKIFRL